MLLSSILTASILFSRARCFPASQSLLEESLSTDNGPSLEKARDNAQHVFNAVHAAMRQWDSSLKHNGMSFFPATIPNNTLLYHGDHTKEPLKEMEWLAFEIEHAEMFANARPGPPGKRPGRPGREPPGEGGPGKGPPPFEGTEEGEKTDEPMDHGYLHTYRTSRPLTKLLYIDGMSAGKTTMGTMDSQDLILGNESDVQSPISDWVQQSDWERAQNLCALGAEAGIEGFLRMEAGFELILCNFTDGLEFVSAYQRPDSSENPRFGLSDMNQFEYLRGVSTRYHGIDNGRVVLDYSSMISAFFYNCNLTNPDPNRAALPRLMSTSLSERRRIKSDIISLFSSPKEQKNTINWQGITDMIVTRYADRLQFLVSENITHKTMLSELNFLLDVFVDYNEPDMPDSIEKCTNIYLTPAFLTTISDHLIYASLSTITNKICTTLFEIRNILLQEHSNPSTSPPSSSSSSSPSSPSPSPSPSPLHQPTHLLIHLLQHLDWPTWKECGKCAPDEICFVAIWPWGAKEDHDHPGCRRMDALVGRGYWDFWDGLDGLKEDEDGDAGREDL